MPLLGEGDALQPLRVLGTGVPDLLSVADRSVRLRERLLVFDADPRLTAFCEGVRRHLHDDGWFHSTRAFAEVTAQLGVTLRETFGPGDGFRSGFLGHIGAEMLLDDVLRERAAGCLPRYYEAMNAVDPEEAEALVNRLHPRGTDRLAKIVRGFCDSRFLEDYADSARLLFRMNQVCRRVGLTPLPDAAVTVLAEARTTVDRRRFELLPPDRYAWPPAALPR
ncbi:hypothetical protein [Alienimonas sp. DA493]|uniref:hypothetical protein n=1 Tax=Alienimonas sp. DA493 TaxID=3373605 RepID=UPI0037544034